MEPKYRTLIQAAALALAIAFVAFNHQSPERAQAPAAVAISE